MPTQKRAPTKAANASDFTVATKDTRSNLGPFIAATGTMIAKIQSVCTAYAGPKKPSQS